MNFIKIVNFEKKEGKNTEREIILSTETMAITHEAAGMNTPVWTRNEIESPCVQVCVLHPEARICLGCYRSGDEIAGWSKMTPEERRKIMDELPTRAASLPKSRRGGRAARLKRL